ncbi:MAG TPA: HAD-IB family phosphatase [Patescibacteria group bacterium]|nr:HAD-IB family phosphatase [Patescibacteria group bacterium]
MKRKLAIFDIDGTIFRSSLVIQMVHRLVENGMFPKEANEEIEQDYLAWLNRKGTYEKYIWQVVKIHLKYIGGCSVKKVEHIADQLIRDQKDRVYRFTRSLIADLRTKNYFLLALSGSPDYIVSAFAQAYHFDGSFGSTYLTNNGVFTGEGVSLKKQEVLSVFLREKINEIDPKDWIAVGDTKDDIPTLETVGQPIALNPDQGLAEYAKKKGWRIVVERKDVIYDMRAFDFVK